MKIYKTQEQVEKDIKNGVLAIEGDVKFECSISIDADIVVTNGDINARNINAWNITARNISYYAFCCVYQSIKCKSIEARRHNAREPICLDGKLEIIKEPETLSGKEVDITIDGKTYKAIIKE